MRPLGIAFGLLLLAPAERGGAADSRAEGTAGSGRARVDVVARAFESGKPIAGAEIRWLECGRAITLTDRGGRASLLLPVGQELTLTLHHPRYDPLQTATVTVPAQGLCGPDRQLTFQVPHPLTYRLLRLALAPRHARQRHAVVTTVTAAGKRLGMTPHGEAGASVKLITVEGGPIPQVDGPLYFDTLPITGHTDPLRTFLRRRGPLPALDRTTPDGGVAFANVEPGRYVLVAEKDGVHFSSCTITIRDDSPALINASPPHGPRVLSF